MKKEEMIHSIRKILYYIRKVNGKESLSIGKITSIREIILKSTTLKHRDIMLNFLDNYSNENILKSFKKGENQRYNSYEIMVNLIGDKNG